MTDSPDLQSFAAFAETLARAARAETLSRFMSGCAADDKGGAAGYDPVTEADRAAERAMRALIEQAFPGHGIAGEEYGEKAGEGRWTWSLDPVDGTRAFICGLPSWTTLIALLDEGRPVLGLIDTPRLDETYLGYADGAWLIHAGERRAIRTSGCRKLAEARISNTEPFMHAGQGFERVRAQARLARWGLDAYAYARLAAGGLDLVLETGLKPHDYNALIPVVRGAGGVAGDWSGGGDFSGGALVTAASAELFDEAVALLEG